MIIFSPNHVAVADIGHVAKSVAAYFGALSRALERGFAARDKMVELSRMSDAQLAQQGISRSDINRIIIDLL